jgi:multidrug efflux pump
MKTWPKVTKTLQDEIAKNPGIVSLDVDLRLNKPEISLEVDRERAADLGVPVDVIARAVETAMGGRSVTQYKREGEKYDVVVQTEAKNRNTPLDVEKIFVRGRADTMVPLSALVKMKEVVVPRELNHFAQRRSVSFTANLAPNYSLGQSLAFMKEVTGRVLKTGYSTDVNGNSREFVQSSGSLTGVFVLALVFIFLVLAAQFESFVDPFVILLSVPLSMVGALLALQWTGSTLNVYSQIGLITLVGLITKHGILIVEFANQLRMTGMSAIDAVHKSATLRLRPILMTTGAMVLGAIPLGLGHWRWLRKPSANWLGDCGGHVLGYLVDHFCGAHHVLLVCPQGNAWADSNRLRGRHGFCQNRLAFQVLEFLPCVGVGKRMAGIVGQVEIHACIGVLRGPSVNLASPTVQKITQTCLQRTV